MEVPCLYRFPGPQNLIKLLKNLLDIENNLSVGQIRRRTTEQESSCKKKKQEMKTLCQDVVLLFDTHKNLNK